MQTSNQDISSPLPHDSSLESLSEIRQSLEGITLRTLAPGSTIYARTRHNDYRILLLDPESGQALVQGGRFFAEPTEATVMGATMGDYGIELGWICVGLRLEISLDGQPILTSPVQSLRVEHKTGLPFTDNEQRSQLPS